MTNPNIRHIKHTAKPGDKKPLPKKQEAKKAEPVKKEEPKRDLAKELQDLSDSLSGQG